jgi:redox-sensing transcriptional repressor
MGKRDKHRGMASAPIRLGNGRHGPPRLQTRPLERLMRYYQFVSEQYAPGGCENTPRTPTIHVTSAQIAEALDVDPTQVRKDFGAIGLVGLGRVGYDVCEVCRTIRALLRFDQPYEAVLIGAGHLGGALLAYRGFMTYGLRVVAAFDNDPRKIGTRIAGLTVKPMRLLRPQVSTRGIPLAIVTVPAAVAQQVADRAIAAGVQAIWNFSPTQIAVPPRVVVRHEHISLGLAVLANRLKR